VDEAISGQAQYRPSAEVLAQNLPSGETVLLHLGTEKYFGLDAVGARVWSGLEAGFDLDAIHRRLLDDYDVAADQLSTDLAALVQHLLHLGLVRSLG
jgi:hypothetical protein